MIFWFQNITILKDKFQSKFIKFFIETNWNKWNNTLWIDHKHFKLANSKW